MYLTHVSSAAIPAAPGAAGLLLPTGRRAARGTPDRVLERRQVEVGADGTVTVSAEIAALLGLADSEPAVTPMGDERTFSAARRRTRAEPVTIDPNVPMADRRFIPMTLEDLLKELAQRVAGFGPPDVQETLNPATAPWTRRKGDIEVALMYAPGREQDRLRLKAAVSHLDPMFYDHHRLVGEIRRRRPDLEPVLEQWSADVLAPALSAALQAPLNPDGSPQAVFGPLFAQINEPSSRSYDDSIAQLEQRMAQRHELIFAEKLTRFFRFLSSPVQPGEQTANGVLGASKSITEGRDMRRLLGGTVVFRCDEAELRGHLQMVPAAKVRMVQAMPTDAMRFGEGRIPHYAASYPYRASGTTIQGVVWQPVEGQERRVLVANWKGVHSYSIDGGFHWTPTGGLTSRAVDDMRADAWRAFLAERWHEHRESNLMAYPFHTAR